MTRPVGHVVLDASALVLTAQHPSVDPRSETARVAVGEASAFGAIVAPALLAWEIGNLVFVKRAKDWPDDDAREDVVRELTSGIELVVPDGERLAKAGALARRHGLSFYDASYVQLAKDLDGSWLITEDAAMLKVARLELGDERAHDVASATTALQD